MKQKKAKEEKLAQELSDSTWGQLEVMQTFAKDTVTKAQGYEDPEPVEEVKVVVPPPKKLTPKEQEEKETEKMRLFSEFVAADAEASTPVIKKPDPMEAPLHFKYYQNEGDDASLVEQTTDAILGGESKQVTKGKVNLKYDHSDPDWHIEPIAPVDYSKSQLNIDQLMEPIETMDVQETDKIKIQEPEKKSSAAEEEVVELTTT